MPKQKKIHVLKNWFIDQLYVKLELETVRMSIAIEGNEWTSQEEILLVI